ncbi:MAG TPA: hypothetical protein VLS90_04980, partial [Thermodesulfobacteriota bacterium]|nr:hypothetical protein [Thermodesulfobacteriota bacterium]
MNILEGKDWKSNYHLPSPPDDKEGKILQVFRVSGVKDESLRAANLYVYGLDGTEKPLPSFSEFDGINGVYSPPTYRLAGKKDEMLPDYIYPSIGLPLRGLIPTRYTLNLLPFELRKKVREVGKPVFLGLLAVCIILAAILGSGMYNRYRNELEALRAEVKKKKPEVEAIQKLQNQVTEVYAQISEYDKMTRGAVREVD